MFKFMKTLKIMSIIGIVWSSFWFLMAASWSTDSSTDVETFLGVIFFIAAYAIGFSITALVIALRELKSKV
jgi:hypothetical protein